MKIFAALALVTAMLTACGSDMKSESKDSSHHFRNSHHGHDSNKSPKIKIACEIKVNQWTPGQGQLLAEVTSKVVGTKTFADIQAAYADSTEIFNVATAADRKCSADGVFKVNTAACSQISANVNSGNIGRYTTFNINNGQSTGYYQCTGEAA